MLAGYAGGLESANFDSIYNIGTYEKSTDNMDIKNNTDNKLCFHNLLTLYK